MNKGNPKLCLPLKNKTKAQTGKKKKKLNKVPSRELSNESKKSKYVEKKGKKERIDMQI